MYICTTVCVYFCCPAPCGRSQTTTTTTIVLHACPSRSSSIIHQWKKLGSSTFFCFATVWDPNVNIIRIRSIISEKEYYYIMIYSLCVSMMMTNKRANAWFRPISLEAIRNGFRPVWGIPSSMSEWASIIHLCRRTKIVNQYCKIKLRRTRGLLWCLSIYLSIHSRWPPVSQIGLDCVGRLSPIERTN